jgi:hypothetical protein
MTHDVRRIPAIALGVAAFVSFSAAHADAPVPASGVAASSDSAEPAPTPRTPEALGSPARTPAQAQRVAHATTHRHVARRHVWRYRYYGYRSDDPVGEFASGVVGGAADLGSMAAYPFYCFPNYGRCHVRLPYRP